MFFSWSGSHHSFFFWSLGNHILTSNERRSLVISQIFAAPPFLLNTAQLGYIGFGPVVGGFIGCILCGFLSDPVARWMTRRNNGIYEPEFRLPLMALLPIVSTIGYFLFGNLIIQGKSPVAAAAMWGLVFISVQVAAVSTGTFFMHLNIAPS